jgi:hypothetical protein
MPNTLAHFGVQGVATRALIRRADAKWVFLGCIISDIPWILIRFLRNAFPGVDPYDLRLYALVLTSLGACLILSAALAVISERPGIVFGILAFNSLLGLLLDAVQIKWGNGVHLFAPFSWKLVSFELFWPESWQTYSLIIFGISYFLWAWARSPGQPIALLWQRWRRTIMGVALLGVYLVVPLAFLSGPEARDNHSIRTLRHTQARPGQALILDREAYVVRDGKHYVSTFAGEEIRVTGRTASGPGTVSIKGRFVDSHTVSVAELREHIEGWRDAASVLGLALLLAMWVTSLLKGRAIVDWVRGTAPGRWVRP